VQILLLTWLACGPVATEGALPGVPAATEDQASFAKLSDQLAAVRELEEPVAVPVRVIAAEGWELRRGQAAVAGGLDDHAPALAGLGLLPEPSALAAHVARRGPPIVWDRELGMVLTTQAGLSDPARQLAAAHSVLPTCEPAAWTWDARRVAEAIQDAMAVVLTWEQQLVRAGLRPRGHAVDPALPLAPWTAAPVAHPSPLAQDDDVLRTVATDVVLRLLDAGEWRTVDMACKRLPSTTAALLHPDRWQAGEGPDPVGPADVPTWSDAGWRQVHSDRMGELALGSWLAYTAQVGSDTQARELATGWRGDAVSIWQHPDDPDLRAAWTVNLAPDARKEAARLLHGRVLQDGRVVEVRPGPGDALVLLIGGSGSPVVTVREAARGGIVAVRLGASVDLPSWERTLRLQANPVSASDGVARVGSLYFPLAEGWRTATRGTEGDVLSMRHTDTDLRLVLYEAPSLLVGPVDVAAERVARLVSSQAGMTRPVHVRQVGACAVATVVGRDRNRRTRQIRVHVLPTDAGVAVVRASHAPRAVPVDYHRLVRSLEEGHCRGPQARRAHRSSTSGQ